MTRQAWDYVYLGGTYPADCAIPEENLAKLRTEFQYWYPVDLRVSGKDLVPNHLTFFLYTHCAVWGDKQFPKAVRANGHLLLNKAKMSKSTGNFMTLADAIKEFGADMTRFALADAGDGMDDANFESTTVNAAILRMYTQLEWTQSVLKGEEATRTGPSTSFHDKVLDSAINTAINAAHKAFSGMLYRDALKVGFYDLQNARNSYIAFQSPEDEDLNVDLLKRFIEVQALLLSPFCPHYTEEIWELLGKEGSIMNAAWPVAGDVDDEAIEGCLYIEDLAASMRAKLNNTKHPKKGKATNPTKVTITYTDVYPEWQQATLDTLAQLYQEDQETYENNKEIVGILKSIDSVKPHMKKVMTFVSQTKAAVSANGAQALKPVVRFREGEVLGHYTKYLSASIGLPVEIVCESKADKAEPKKPFISYSE
ncbi:hypothetical protein SARC_12693 [Sphaeroforma arctica JP610]|uniref:Leucine--tRNA ligase n=1 Tax=Sphaeroforma arctica JP610 TaxID=667725 RepID=A0A0L0FFE9_9EUKA|nr:hypothetical protein SARC_12693 [Sphaeroforma arctica JP610]KNC74768.1 hypothetical protein SARC_12693 [Sphaeroforma arctica JP610]|eukprot:XP_014148670.1 hypothetical protein SARC_12693 [Sphaeroforma arctica JP610]